MRELVLDLPSRSSSRICPQNLWITLWTVWAKVTQVSVSLASFSVWSSFDRRKMRRANKGLRRHAALKRLMRQVCDSDYFLHVCNLC
jgi:hypothetical protein